MTCVKDLGFSSCQEDQDRGQEFGKMASGLQNAS